MSTIPNGCEELRMRRRVEPDLDDEILQKILPRLHGSRMRVGPLLGALGWYLHSGDKAEAMKFFPAPG